MSKISVPYLSSITPNSVLQDVSVLMNELPRHVIENAPWIEYSYKPAVSFAIGYTDHSIVLKYYINEKSIRGFYASANMPVYQDSCLEFFLSFDNDTAYYNMEFNCIGTCLLGYGKKKTGRSLLNEEIISKIKRHVIIQIEDANTLHWELVVDIPKEVFIHHSINDFSGRDCKANFYKCGDHLPEPHYLAWNNIVTDSPDFHLPEFFGNIHFV